MPIAAWLSSENKTLNTQSTFLPPLCTSLSPPHPLSTHLPLVPSKTCHSAHLPSSPIPSLSPLCSLPVRCLCVCSDSLDVGWLCCTAAGRPTTTSADGLTPTYHSSHSHPPPTTSTRRQLSSHRLLPSVATCSVSRTSRLHCPPPHQSHSPPTRRTSSRPTSHSLPLYHCTISPRSALYSTNSRRSLLHNLPASFIDSAHTSPHYCHSASHCHSPYSHYSSNNSSSQCNHSHPPACPLNT